VTRRAWNSVRGTLLASLPAAAPTEGSAARGASVCSGWQPDGSAACGLPRRKHKVRRNKNRRNVSPRAVTGSIRPASERQEPLATKDGHVAENASASEGGRTSLTSRPWERAPVSKSLLQNTLTRHGRPCSPAYSNSGRKQCSTMRNPLPHKGLRAFSAAAAQCGRTPRKRRNVFGSNNLRRVRRSVEQSRNA